jgi:adenylate cyclase class 2
VVTVPEIDGTHLEVETMVAAHDVGAALASLRELLHTLGVTDAELTTQTYTGAVQAAWESGGD